MVNALSALNLSLNLFVKFINIRNDDIGSRIQCLQVLPTIHILESAHNNSHNKTDLRLFCWQKNLHEEVEDLISYSRLNNFAGTIEFKVRLKYGYSLSAR